MRDKVKFPVLPDLASIDLSHTSRVRMLLRERHAHLFGPQDDAWIDEYMDAIEDLFAGRHPEYQAMDTPYHDLAHTLQATLCLAELLHNRHFAGAEPRIAADDFRRAVIAVLFHDIGYLKTRDDTEGSGAKYTHLHEKRSCAFVRDYLSELGWPQDDIRSVENLISATGPTADVTKIDFGSEVERVLGQAVCTADYVGQMSDPGYPDKLRPLFGEFAESYRYQLIPESQWPFPSYEAMLRSTPGFWGTFVQHKLNVECAGICRHLEHPLTGENRYIESIERNMATIARRIDALDGPPPR
ncbi:MAG: HD domain-containing protein [Xanthomonadales bacterium]|nr:HD domain-containing protein [Xanthomonadales bacterium]